MDIGDYLAKLRGLATILALGLTACDVSNQNSPSTNPTPSATAGNSNPLDNLNDQDRKTFAGGGEIGGPIAKISVPQSKEEISWLATGDIGTFVRAAKRLYPDIANVRFEPSPEMVGDSETQSIYRNSFYAGLYFSKQIKTGDGSSLFDLLTKCGRLKDPTSGAEMGVPMGEHKARWVSLQFFPIFRKIDNDEKIDLQILFDRDSDKITARSPLFSSRVLDGSSFLRDHGVKCV